MNLKDSVKDMVTKLRALIAGQDKALAKVKEYEDARMQALRDIEVVTDDISVGPEESAKLLGSKRECIRIVDARLPRAVEAVSTAGTVIFGLVSTFLDETLQPLCREEFAAEQAKMRRALQPWAAHERELEGLDSDLSLIRTLSFLTMDGALSKSIGINPDYARESGERLLAFLQQLQEAGSFLQKLRAEAANRKN